MTPRVFSLLSVLMVSGWALATVDGRDRTRQVSGWPIANPQLWGQDPLLGTLACPPLTRLNLRTKRSEPVLLEGVQSRRHGQGQEWAFAMGKKATWWSGEAVTEKDLERFLESQLSEIKDKNIYKWSDYELIRQQGRVLVRWKKVPSFGPYVFDGVAFRRSGDEKECAGDYKVVVKDGTFLLQGKKQTIRLKKSGKADVQFRLSTEFSPQPGDDPVSCPQRVPLPVVTGLSWNTEEGPMAKRSLRQVVTELTPRGALLRTGAGHLGDLLSGPFLRVHPGYNRSILVRPFNLRRGSKKLASLGYARPSSDALVKGKSGEPLVLAIEAPRSSTFLKKVLKDALASVGLGVTYYDREQAKIKSKSPVPWPDRIDGRLTTLSLPWPSADYREMYHSRLRQKDSPLWPLKDEQLDRSLEGYGRSLTMGRPNFKYLRNVHRRLFQLEPMTILLQHSVCLAQPKVSKKVDVTDPDWLRRLIEKRI